MTKGIIIFFVGLSLVYFFMNTAANWVESKPSPPETRFEVIDTYKGCDVVQYLPEYSGRYYFFLHCK